jgi:hypothetical protein
MTITKMLVTTAMLAGALSASGADGESAKFESTFYKDWPLFSTYARETTEKQPIEHFGPVGIGIDLVLTRFWSGDTLLDLARLEALKMTVKDDYLFIEAGGFSAKNPLGWKSPLVVMKRK